MESHSNTWARKVQRELLYCHDRFLLPFYIYSVRFYWCLVWFQGEQRRLALYAALFLPFRKTVYKDNKGKMVL